MHGSVNRRRLFGSAVALLGLGLLARPRQAAALTSQPMLPGSRAGLAYAGRCQAVPAGTDREEHSAIVARLRAELAGAPSVPSASEACPLCGCPILVTRQDL